MQIKDDQEFESKMTQLCRMYRALHEIWARTYAKDPAQIAKWVVAGGRVMDMITVLLAELEDYSGCAELRVIIEELKQVERDRQAKVERT